MNLEENKNLADLLFPKIASGEKPNRLQIEEKYKVRDLTNDKAEIMRLAPSPTGELHAGSLYLAIVSDIISHKSDGKLILRIEDTDKEREILGAAERMEKFLNFYGVKIDESPTDGGEYGPYVQSQRVDIYNAFLYDFLLKDFAYPCFMSSEELTKLREEQTAMKVRTGIYGPYAKSRNLSFEEIENKIKAGEKYVLRLKSSGDFSKKIIFVDEIMGEMHLSENDEDFVIAKADGVPTYHFAHLIDDYTMRVTFVMRANEWVASITKHLELWNKLGISPVKYGHIMPINKRDAGKNGNSSVRKLSKRKDPEASVHYYLEKGYTVDALRAYLIRLANPSFDEWWDNHVKESDEKRVKINLAEYDFNLEEIKRNSRGPLLDFAKLNNISADIVAGMNKEEISESVLTWAEEYDKDFFEIINKDKDYLQKVLNIERETEQKRKDISHWSEIKNNINYFYDELFLSDSLYSELKNNLLDTEKEVLSIIKIELEKDENKKLFAENTGETISIDDWILEFKNIYNNNFVNNESNSESNNLKFADLKFGSMMMLIRRVVTGKDKTPNLYYVFEVLGREKVLDRL